MKKLSLIIFLSSVTSVFSQSLLTDPSSGCRYTLPWNCDDCTLNWTGNCIDSLPNGEGTLTVSYDTLEVMKYEGRMKNGHFDGFGVYRDGMGEKEGYFKNSNPVYVDPSLHSYIEENQISDSDTSGINHSFYGIETLYYYAIRPKKNPMGALVLLPSLYEQPEQVLSSNSALIKLAHERDFLVIIPSINANFSLEKAPLDFLNNVFSDATAKYHCPETNFIVGGFSLGGMNSLRYTELAFENKSVTVIKPLAVFAVDPPVDFVNLYNRELVQLAKDSTYSEAKLVLDGFHKAIGTPTANYDQFVRHSVYSRAEDDGGNIKYLRDVPVRTYCDPDINWWLENRNFSYYDINAPDLSAMILQLKELGNTNAEFINALGKGYRLDGRRHPHSWSLIDPDECMSWILSIMN